LEKSETIIIVIGIVLGVLGSIVSITLSETEILKPKPKFIAQIDSEINNFTHGEKVIISNVGNLQAKNIEIIIGASESLKFTEENCLEGTVASETENLIKLSLSKFSTNIQCVIEFFDSPTNNINTLVVTGDDSDGYQHNFELKKEEPLVIPPILDLPPEFFIILISYIGMVLSVVFLFRKRIQRKKIQDYYKQRERELLNLSEDIEEKFEYEKSKSIVDDKTFLNQISLSDQLMKTRNEINSAHIIQNYPNSAGIINEFFEKWGTLESNMVNKLGSVPSNIDAQTPRNIIQAFRNKELISKDLFLDFKDLLNFRNSLIHESIKPETSKIKHNIKLLENSIGKLNQIKYSPEHIVSIPPGCSVPGCEEYPIFQKIH